MSEIVFDVVEDEVDGGWVARALGYGITTQAESLEDLRDRVREAVDCCFDDVSKRPSVIYRELWQGFQAFDAGDAASACWYWKFSYESHWSHHAAGAIYALDAFCRGRRSQ